MATAGVGALEIGYDRAGAGDPIVLLHGAASDAREWRRQVAGLSDEFDVIAWDEPGAGRSSDVPAGFGLADYADALAGLIDTLGLGRAHVGGLSWGGVVAQELYRRHRDRVGTLILADTYAGWKGSLPMAEVEARVEGFRAQVDAGRVETPNLFGPDPPADVLAEIAAIQSDARPASVHAVVEAIAAADQRDLLPRINVPTLLVWGEHDLRSPLTVARTFDREIPDTSLVVIADAGHMTNMEQPELVDRAVRNFCRTHPL